MRCPECQAPVAEADRFCASCGKPIRPPKDLTSAPDEATRTSGGPARTPSSGAGWLSSSGSIDHGRFTPGVVLDNRYRIVGLLGRGGMGEVYRADDLRLGQSVALKFLPPALAQDAARLAQFHNEVRTARQVSHPNVCRVYDIGDLDGQLFLTMEYVDGEDLAASLRRVGRFPEDRAIELARQICAGLAAAHARGVLHRDLKPANIMLDRAGRVRLMDFGLATVGQSEEIGAGTPAYMAPEQLAGRAATVASDIYALGLVLYELFTGRRAFDAKTLAGLMDQHAADAITAPTDVVPALDPVVERAILRCLDRDPARRPDSALAVSASLPGADPLAAALAAGETPSPEMVAAAGTGERALSPVAAGAWLVACVVMLVAAAGLSDRVILLAEVPFDRAPATLFDRARDLERRLGSGDLVADRAAAFTTRSDVLAWLRLGRSDADRLRILAAGRPPVIVFWYRSSPQPFVPEGNAVGPFDPPSTLPGMTILTLDTEGRLTGFQHVPSPAASTAAGVPIEWSALFEAAGFDFSRFNPVPPESTPRVYADTRMAWTGTLAELPDVPLRVEAGAYRARPVFFVVTGPWSPSSQGQTTQGADATGVISFVATLVVVPGMLLAGALMARANVKRGRGDRKGAMRLATAVFVMAMGGWLFVAHHVFDATLEQARFFKAIALSLFDAGTAWVFYLAAEPHVRRIWPHILITWSRLLGGSLRDPMVGRDLLIGLAAGVSMTLVSSAFYLIPGWMGWPAFEPRAPGLWTLLGTRYVVAAGLLTVSQALQNSMLGVLGLALLRLVLRREWLAFAVATALFTPLAARGQFQSGVVGLDLAFGAVVVAIILAVLFRFGLFAGIAGFFAHFWTFGVPLSLDPGHQYFQTGVVAMALVGALALMGFRFSRGPGRRSLA